MPQVIKASCSLFQTHPEQIITPGKGTKGVTLVECTRDNQQCIPGKHLEHCPDGAGRTLNLSVNPETIAKYRIPGTRGETGLQKLGNVTITTR